MAVYTLEPVDEEKVISQETVSEGKDILADGVERAVVPESISEKKSEVAKENSYENILEQARIQIQGASGTGGGTTSLGDDVTALSSLEEEFRIQKLVDIALDKGPDHAFKVAIKLDDMYALDMLHDRLSHKLYQELISRGFLKET